MKTFNAASVSPLINDLIGYKASWLPKDLIAGLSIAAVQVPTAIAYAQLAGFPPEAGLYASIFPVIVYSFLASSRQLVVGPDAATCTMVASLIAPLAAGDQTRYVTLAAALSLCSGIFMIVGGFARMGFIVNFFARPILIGFLNGIAASIIVGQMGKFLGISLKSHDFIPTLMELITRLNETHTLTLAVGVGTLVLLALLKKFAPMAPASLIGIVVAALALHGMGESASGVAVLGSVPSGLPHLFLPAVGYDSGQNLVVGAIGLIVVSFTSGMLTARSFAARSGTKIDANREMCALGIANMAAGLSGTFAITGADSRTAVNVACANKTQLSSVFGALAVALVATFFSAPLAYLPLPALAAVLIFSAMQLIDIDSYGELRRIDRFESRLSVLTTLGVLTLGVLPGVAIAILLAVVIVMVNIYKPGDTVLGEVPGLDGYNDIRLSPDAKPVDGALIWRFEGPLVFFNADYFQSRLDEVIAQTEPKPRWLILSMEAISQLDSTGAKAIVQLHLDLQKKEIGLLVARPKRFMRKLREDQSLSTHVNTGDVYPTIRSAVESLASREGSGQHDDNERTHSFRSFFESLHNEAEHGDR